MKRTREINKRAVSRYLLLFLFVCLTGIPARSWQFHRPAGSAADLAMGGSMGTVSPEPFALYDNPASLVLDDQAKLQLSAVYQNGTVDRQWYATANKLAGLSPANFAGKIPFMLNGQEFAIGASYLKLWSLAGFSRFDDVGIQEQGDIYALLGALAWRWKRSLFIGISAGAAWGSGRRTPLAATDLAYDYQLSRGPVISLGVIFEPHQVIQLGVGYGRRYEMNYLEAVDAQGVSRVNADLHMPAEFRVGVMATPWSDLRVSAGIERIKWPRFKLSQHRTSEVLVPVISSALPLARPILQSVQLSFGVAYSYHTLPPSVIIRLGVRSARDALPITLNEFRPGHKADAAAYQLGRALCAGVGTAYGRWTLDLGGEYERTGVPGILTTHTWRGMATLGMALGKVAF
jgi:long-subunit fatty acid transport protein